MFCICTLNMSCQLNSLFKYLIYNIECPLKYIIYFTTTLKFKYNSHFIIRLIVFIYEFLIRDIYV